MARLYTNNYKTTLNGAITNVATTITVTSVTGLPAIGGGQTCNLTIDDGTNIEIVTATAVSGFDLTVTRGAESTTGTAFADGTTIALRATAASLNGVLYNVAEDTTPQLGGDLDLNGNNIDFPTTANISDCLDEDNMASDSATALATQQSIKAYADTKLANVSEDTTPQLGGALDVNGQQITSVSAGDIELHSDNDVNVILGDAAGVDDFNIKDSASATVFTVTSDGNISAFGGQLTFPSTQNASSDLNTLDDYEEGTWSPTFTDSNAAGTYTGSSVNANYIKIGAFVNVTLQTAFSAASGGTGYFQIGNLPFTKPAGQNSAGTLFRTQVDINTTDGANDAIVLFETSGSSSTLFIGGMTSTASATISVSSSAITTSSALTFSIVYKVP